MKLLTTKGLVLPLVIFIVFFQSCSKGKVEPPVPTPKPLPAFLTLKTSTDSVFYGGSVTVEWTTYSANSVSFQGKEVPINGSTVVSGLTSSENLELTARGDGGTVSKKVSVLVHSQRMTIWATRSWKMTERKTRIIPSQPNQPAQNWIYYTPDCNTYTPYPNGWGMLVYGPCNGSLSGQSGLARWEFRNNQTEILLGNLSKIVDLTETALTVTRIVNDAFGATDQWGEILRYETVEVYKPI